MHTFIISSLEKEKDNANFPYVILKTLSVNNDLKKYQSSKLKIEFEKIKLTINLEEERKRYINKLGKSISDFIHNYFKSSKYNGEFDTYFSKFTTILEEERTILNNINDQKFLFLWGFTRDSISKMITNDFLDKIIEICTNIIEFVLIQYQKDFLDSEKLKLLNTLKNS